MPLAEFQTALGTMIALQAAGHASTAIQALLDTLPVSAGERAWLASLPESRGFKVTCDIQRWWRETRLRDTARLTLLALGPAQTKPTLEAYLRTHLCPSLFFLPEALSFLHFVASTSEQPHVSAIAQFEQALLLAREASAEETSSATILEFAAPPEELLDALLQGHPLPEPSAECFPVIVSPSLPHLWCPITTEELLAVRASV